MKHTIGAKSNPKRDLDCNTYTKESDNNNSPDRHHSVTVASNRCQVVNLGADRGGRGFWAGVARLLQFWRRM